MGDRIAVFTDADSNLCDFFDACRFLLYERTGPGWEVTGRADFERIVPGSPAITRKNSEALLPLIDGCRVLAGGPLLGIPFSVFDRAGLRIFEINRTDDGTFDGIIDELREETETAAKDAPFKGIGPVETSTPGVYRLDLIALQREHPQISSKKALDGFLKNTEFTALHLLCRHVPLWFENSELYNVESSREGDGAVLAVITRK